MSDQSAPAELLPCPFCGAKGMMLRPPKRGLWIVECSECSGNSGPHLEWGWAMKAWNTRAASPEGASNRIARLAADLSDFAEALRELSKDT